MTLFELFSLFSDESAALEWFKNARWPAGLRCAHCDSADADEVYCHPSQPFHCRTCRRFFHVKTNTPMACSRLPLRKWAIAIYLHMENHNGISSPRLARAIGVTVRTAWFTLYRIREAFDKGDLVFDGTVEVDKTYVGGRRRNQRRKKREESKGRGTADKMPVVGIRNRETNHVQAEVTDDTTGQVLQYFVYRHVREGTRVYTDDAGAYQVLEFVMHLSANHSSKEYAMGSVYKNGIESL